MKAWLYILRCADGSYYTGSTNNLPLRVAQHQAGERCDDTRHRLPVELVFAEEFPSGHQAFLRERQVKRWSRAKKEALIRGDWEALVKLSQSRSPGGLDDEAEESTMSFPSRRPRQPSFDKLRMTDARMLRMRRARHETESGKSWVL